MHVFEVLAKYKFNMPYCAFYPPRYPILLCILRKKRKDICLSGRVQRPRKVGGWTQMTSRMQFLWFIKQNFNKLTWIHGIQVKKQRLRSIKVTKSKQGRWFKWYNKIIQRTHLTEQNWGYTDTGQHTPGRQGNQAQVESHWCNQGRHRQEAESSRLNTEQMQKTRPENKITTG